MRATDVPLTADDKDARSISKLELCEVRVFCTVYAGN